MTEIGITVGINSQCRDCLGDQREHSERRHEHDHVHQLDDHGLKPFEQREYRSTLFLVDLNQRDADEQGDEHQLKHIAVARGGAEKIVRHHVDQWLEWAALIHLNRSFRFTCGRGLVLGLKLFPGFLG